jgi:hypothetical protein
MTEQMRAVNSAGFAAPAGLNALPVVLAPVAGQLHVLLVRAAQRHVVAPGRIHER